LNSSRIKLTIVCIVVLMLGFSSLIRAEEDDDVTGIYNQIRAQGAKYQVEESIHYITNFGMTMKCTLAVPKTNTSRPIILILHGFGGDRNGFPITGTGERFFERTARILAEQGFCSFRVDFRGCGENAGDYSVTTFSGQVSDAKVALNYIETLADPVDPRRIGLLGHSQGGLVSTLTAASDERIDSLMLWAAVNNPAHDYEGLFKKSGFKKGLAMPNGTSDIFPLYVDDVKVLDYPIRKEFFVEIFNTNPLLAISTFKKPMMYIAALQDVIVWPQPLVGQTYLLYHEGYEKLVSVDASHNYNFDIGPDVMDEVIYWTAAWYIKTLQ